jgi:GTP cyclohydrolase I
MAQVPPSTLPDIQGGHDDRNIAIEKVGVRNVRWPMAVLDRAKGTQHTIGTFSLLVDLPHHFKGTHMSRFIEVLGEHKDEFGIESLSGLLATLRAKLKAETAYAEIRFPYFIQKKAPVSKQPSLMEYECAFFASQTATSFEFSIEVCVPITTLCPCSKEISERGAHNQRGIVTARVRCEPDLWLEEIVEAIESCASCDLYPLLKRPDEKWVTERAYDNPRFVEDVVREVALAFDREPRIHSYEVEVENQESIHTHNAYAYVRR